MLLVHDWLAESMSCPTCCTMDGNELSPTERQSSSALCSRVYSRSLRFSCQHTLVTLKHLLSLVTSTRTLLTKCHKSTNKDEKTTIIEANLREKNMRDYWFDIILHLQLCHKTSKYNHENYNLIFLSINEAHLYVNTTNVNVKKHFQLRRYRKLLFGSSA